MKTSFMLMAQHDGLAVIPIEMVCCDYIGRGDLTKSLRGARKQLRTDRRPSQSRGGAPHTQCMKILSKDSVFKGNSTVH
jgi:hypothetical protein